MKYEEFLGQISEAEQQSIIKSEEEYVKFLIKENSLYAAGVLMFWLTVSLTSIIVF